MNSVRAYLELTKPGITLFIGVSAASGSITASRGLDQPLRFCTMIAATMLMSAGAAALNHYMEKEGDALMRRTAARPIPAGVITPRRAALFAWILSACGLLLSLVLLPFATTAFLMLSHVTYVCIYTPLKRRTALCTLAGAVPGALPVLAGWTAAGVPIGTAAVALTGVLFMWQIPHFLAIAWLARDDYERAGCVLLSTIEPTGRSTARVSLAYAMAMLFCTGMLAMTTPAGAIYVGVGGTATAAYARYAWQFARSPERAAARGLFLNSLIALPLVLGSLALDLVLPF